MKILQRIKSLFRNWSLNRSIKGTKKSIERNNAITEQSYKDIDELKALAVAKVDALKEEPLKDLLKLQEFCKITSELCQARQKENEADIQLYLAINKLIDEAIEEKEKAICSEEKSK